ncbi:hypothetical protein F0U59_36290 [Archangium gephyra]|nr:hypothetical protein F0U59_36290 [Archangium gephyra]
MSLRRLPVLAWFALAPLLAVCSRGPESAPAPVPVAATPPAAVGDPVQPGATPSTYAARPGTETHLSLEWENTTVLAGLEVSDDAPAAATGRVRVVGTLALAVLSTTTLRATLGLTGLEVSSLDTDLPPEANAVLRSLLSRPFELDVAPSGALLALRMDREARDEQLVVGLVTSIARIARPSLPEEPSRVAVVPEEDLTGRSLASHAFRDGRLVKTRTAYTQLYGAPPSAAGSASVKGETQYTLDAEGSLVAARVDETLVLSSGQPGSASLRTTSRTQALLSRTGGSSPTRSTADPGGGASPLVPVHFEAIARATFARGAASYTPPPTVESALLRLGALGDALPIDRDRLRGVVLRELVRTLRARPEAAAAIGGFVSTHGEQDIIGVVALSALRIVGDAPCQRAMVSLLERARSLPFPAARQALIQAGGLQEPMPAIAVVLGGLARKGEDDIARGAALALGRVAGHLPKERAKEWVDVLVSLARRAANDDVRGTYLAALGNARTDRADVLALFDAALNSRDPRLRARGVDAFRLVPGGRADAVLRARMTKDRDPNVRTAAVVASRARPLVEYLPVYDALLANEEEAVVRRSVVEVLAGAGPEAAGVRPLLERVAARDVDEDVRELAHRALAPANSSREQGTR